MPTEIEEVVRQNWAWRKRGKSRWLPLPGDVINVPDMYLIQGFYYILVCVETDFEADLKEDINNIFLDEDVFASKAWYNNVDDEIYELSGIFDDPYEESNPDTTIGIQSIGPTFKCELSDIGNTPRKDDKLKICVRGTNRRFKVVTSQPDGTGLTVLTLHRV